MITAGDFFSFGVRVVWFFFFLHASFSSQERRLLWHAPVGTVQDKEVPFYVFSKAKNQPRSHQLRGLIDILSLLLWTL